MNVTQKGITILLRSGITGEKLQLPADFSLEEAFGILRRQSMAPLAYEGAVQCGVPAENPVMQKMLMICYQNLMQHELQMRAVNRILEAFEANKIPHMPVKGCNMKKLYPKPELRAMGDADILIHPQDHGRIRTVMTALGFDFLSENDHVFEWNSKDLYVELHKSLVPVDDEDYYAYYNTGWQLAVQGSGYRHDLSTEDAYIFIFTHFARHYRRGGIGCRHVVDLFVYRRAFPNMDMDYIRRELTKLHLQEFHENVLRMLDVWFLGVDQDETTDLITAFIFSGGNWGTMEAETYSREVKKARKTGAVKNTVLKSALTTFFPPISQLSYRYTIIRKCPWLLPIIWVVRWVDILLFRPQKIRKRVHILQTINNEKVLSHQQALEAVGLDFYF